MIFVNWNPDDIPSMSAFICVYIIIYLHARVEQIVLEKNLFELNITFIHIRGLCWKQLTSL